MSGPNPPEQDSFGDEPDETGGEPTTDTGFSQAYSAPESEQFTSGPYVPLDANAYDYDAYDPDADYDDGQVTPRWPWIVGVAAILAAVALVASVVLLVVRPSLTSNQAVPTTTTPSLPPVQDQITTTTPPPPPPPPTTTEPPPPPPPPTETVTVTPSAPPPPTETPAPPPAPAPAPTSAAPPPTSAAPAAPRQVTYTVTGTKAPGDIITVTFVDASGHSRTQRNVYIPWSFTLTPISQSEIGSVQASSFFRVSRLNCSITASDGTVLSQQSDNSPTTSC
jgi:Mycobacterium membrane protein